MHYLIIGAQGFIGRHLSSGLSSTGDQVTRCDLLNTGNVDFALDPQKPDFDSVFKNSDYTHCIFAAGAANVGFSMENPDEDFQLNAVQLFQLLEAIRKYNPSCRLIYLSSAAVYGNPEKIPVNESAALQPISPYGFHKMFGENICREFFQIYSIKTCSVRPFSLFGPGLRKQLFWDLYQRSKLGKDVILSGKGDESRDFIFIDDFVKAITAVSQKAIFNGEVINIASGIETTIKEAAEKFFEVIGEGNRAIFNGEKRMGDPLKWKADIGILSSYGFKPEFDLTRGLTNYVQWLKAEEKK